jgi:hypothetical protein
MRPVLVLWVAGLAAGGAPLLADDWTARKCALYGDAWDYLMADGVPEGVSAEFVAGHEAFVASGCQARGHVCPESAAEREIADMLSLMAVAEGMAGSFLPFGCME